MDPKQLDEQVEKILATRSVSKAQKLMESESGIWLIALVSFIESALPIPILTDPFLIAGIMLNRAKTATIVFVATVASVMGGAVAYLSAIFFLEQIQRILSAENMTLLSGLTEKYYDSTVLVAVVGAITPIPYTSAAWAVAIIGGNLAVFVIASFFGRGFRYIVVGYFTYRFGPAAVKHAKRSLGITSLVIFILAGIYLWHKM